MDAAQVAAVRRAALAVLSATVAPGEWSEFTEALAAMRLAVTAHAPEHVSLGGR